MRAPARRSRRSKSSDYRTVERLEQIPNIGPSLAEDLRLIGIDRPEKLPGKDPYRLYDRLCRATGVRQDPCVLDTFIAAVRFMEGAPPHPWWHYTAERKATLARGVPAPTPASPATSLRPRPGS
jgi:pathogenicity locus Cdd1 protein